MTLPNEDVRGYLQRHFVLAHKNIERESHVGVSHGYGCKQSAVGTTNGAGGRNVQFLVLAPDRTVVHVVPGFWHAEDLIDELQLGLELAKLYGSDSMSQRRKDQMFELLHASHLRQHGKAAMRRGDWQNFDRSHELWRATLEPRDTVRVGVDGKLSIRPLIRVLHDRMLAQRFQKLDEFDLEAFVDYGRPFYDNNNMEKGRKFARAVRINEKRQREIQKERERLERERAKEQRRVARAQRDRRSFGVGAR